MEWMCVNVWVIGIRFFEVLVVYPEGWLKGLINIIIHRQILHQQSSPQYNQDPDNLLARLCN